MTPKDTIRAALKMMIGYGTNREQLIAADKALAALAELERASGQLVRNSDELRARLAAIDAAPVVAEVNQGDGFRYLTWGDLPPHGTELIARPAKEAK